MIPRQGAANAAPATDETPKPCSRPGSHSSVDDPGTRPRALPRARHERLAPRAYRARARRGGRGGVRIRYSREREALETAGVLRPRCRCSEPSLRGGEGRPLYTDFDSPRFKPRATRSNHLVRSIPAAYPTGTSAGERRRGERGGVIYLQRIGVYHPRVLRASPRARRKSSRCGAAPKTLRARERRVFRGR